MEGDWNEKEGGEKERRRKKERRGDENRGGEAANCGGVGRRRPLPPHSKHRVHALEGAGAVALPKHWRGNLALQPAEAGLGAATITSQVVRKMASERRMR